MSPLHLASLPLDLRGLRRWAAVRGFGEDEGRALHHLLAETIGKGLLQPFRLMAAHGAARASLYAYAREDAPALLQVARECGLPDALAVCDIARLAAKTMPESWKTGRRLAFDLRARPANRLHKPADKFPKGAEVDAYLVEALRRFPDGRPPPEERVVREVVYLHWLSERLQGAARCRRCPHRQFGAPQVAARGDAARRARRGLARRTYGARRRGLLRAARERRWSTRRLWLRHVAAASGSTGGRFGPGSSVTHDALVYSRGTAAASPRSGKAPTLFYTAPPLLPDTSAAARAQVRLWADPQSRMDVARAMYEIRFFERKRGRRCSKRRTGPGPRGRSRVAGSRQPKRPQRLRPRSLLSRRDLSPDWQDHRPRGSRDRSCVRSRRRRSAPQRADRSA